MFWSKILDNLKKIVLMTTNVQDTYQVGQVIGVSGLLIQAKGLENAAMGSICVIENSFKEKFTAEIVGFKNGECLLMPFSRLTGIAMGSKVYLKELSLKISPSDEYIGRVLDALGNPIDTTEPITSGSKPYSVKNQAPLASTRGKIQGKLDLGVKSINTFLTMCKGQRMGIFAGSGVGKSTLMGMISKFCLAEVNVICLVGERGREVTEFLEDTLGPEAMAKSIVVVATGDEPALMRRQAAYTATTIAEYFADLGKDVMLMMDSVTRFAMAQREIGLSAGEPPTSKGYTPSVFAELPQLLERSGPRAKGKGTITAIYTVLVDGGDMDEPIADAVRGILDGHIVLSRDLAERGVFPAVDVLKSVSRVMPDCNTAEENKVVTKAKRLYSRYRDMEEIIRLGAYTSGADETLDLAIALYPQIEDFLIQSKADSATFQQCYNGLTAILNSNPAQEG
ncbi:MAG: flagellar protein export ATPase FliI [Proteobacteria bacterium]|nr:flagellar protein export ATPase FliI [Pseudomonadota bacterium]